MFNYLNLKPNTCIISGFMLYYKVIYYRREEGKSMKKIVIIVSVSLILVLSGLFGLNQMNKLKDMTQDYDQLLGEFAGKQDEYVLLEEAFRK